MSRGNLVGQSAIEYLMTYGWMLLVVAVTGGAIFATVGDQSVESVSGFTGADVQVDDFGFTSDEELQLVLRNAGGDSTTVSAVNVTDGSRYSAWTGDLELGVGETSTVTLDNVTQGDGSNALNVDVNYNQGGLTNLQVDGTVSGNLEITEEASTSNENGGSGGDGSNGGSSGNLVSYYSMNEGSGDQASDLEGSNDANLKDGSATCSGGSCPNWVTGVQNSGINLDGSNDHLNVSNPSNLDLSEFTISAWINLDQALTSQASSYPGIVTQRSGDNGFAFFMFDGESDVEALQISVGNGTTTKTMDTSVDTYTWTKWQYVTARYNGSAISTYINSTEINSTQYSLGPASSADTELSIGEVNDVSDTSLNGTIDEVKIWNESLSQSEIQDEYNSY